MERLRKEGNTKIIRHFGSFGVTDVEWTDKDGIRNEAQLKFSSKQEPKVSEEYLQNMKEYARKKPKRKIWLVTKQAFKKEKWLLI